jgi:hypothetical protein
LLELLALVVMMDRLNGLLEADGDEQTDDDGGDVDEEVAPGVGGVGGRRAWVSPWGLCYLCCFGSVAALCVAVSTDCVGRVDVERGRLLEGVF